MKKIMIMAALLVATTVGFTAQGYAAPRGAAEQTTKVEVSSLEALLPYLSRNYVNVVVSPGVYRITADDIKAGKFPGQSEVVEGRVTNVLFPVTGDGSTYDFTDVTVEVETAVFNAFENKGELHDLHILGSNNVVKNLKLVNVGLPTDTPENGCTNIVLDGANNRLEGVVLYSQGSYPYGYGSLFGIGGKRLLPLRKHCACLVRGDDNHLLNCKFYHDAFGHFIFMQGAVNPTIEGCYTEGKMSTTDVVLAEKGTGSDADKVGFMTFYDYLVPEGFTFPIGEDGIRTYATGNTMINGVRHPNRPTGGDIVVKDCIVKHARRGVSLTHGGGNKYVENCTLIGCKSGYSVNDGGKIINSRADAAFGPAIWFFSDDIKNVVADVTIIPYHGEKFTGNKSGQAAIIVGQNNKVTLRAGAGLLDKKESKGLSIYVGGDCKAMGHLSRDNNSPAHNNFIVNESGLMVVVDDNTSGNVIFSDGKVVDNGVENSIN